jgi:hypothetical protein
MHRLTWLGVSDVGQPVTIAFPVSVTIVGPLAVFNTVVLTDGVGYVSSDTAVVIVNARQIWLPLLLRDW